jgi:hypothetical protein
MATEEKAKGYCPFKFSFPSEPQWSCEGEKCMAWRIYDTLKGLKTVYCGLAGKPIEVIRLLKLEQ